MPHLYFQNLNLIVMKNLLLLIFACYCFDATYTQNVDPKPMRKPKPRCPYMCDRPIFGTYNEIYNTLTEKDIDSIKRTLNLIVDAKSMKEIEEGRAYQASHILWRLKDIKWSIWKKKKILNYLKSLIDRIDSGNSFLKAEDREDILDAEGCAFTDSHPLYFSGSCLASILKIDTEFGIDIIDKKINQLAIKDAYFINFREGSIRVISSFYKLKSVNLLCDKFLHLELTDYELKRIQETKLKHKLATSRNQYEAWKAIILESQKDNAYEITEKSKGNWNNYNVKFEEVFGFEKIDLNAHLNLAEKEDNLNSKYWLLDCFFSTLCIEYPYKITDKMIARVDKIYSEIRAKIKNNDKPDFLESAYKAFKTKAK
jgi:hypothetical protein